MTMTFSMSRSSEPVPLAEAVAMHAADGEAWSVSCLFLFWFCSHGGFSPEEELALISGSCGGDPGTVSPLPTLGLFWVLARGSAGGPVSEDLSEREEVAGLALKVSQEKPLQKRPRFRGRGCTWLHGTHHVGCS